MKKVFALMLLSGVFAFTSCDSKKTADENTTEQVVDTDTTDVNYEVEKTVVETEKDTVTKTEEVEVNKETGEVKGDDSKENK